MQELESQPRRQLAASLQTTYPWAGASHSHLAIWKSLLFPPSSPLLLRMRKQKSKGCLQKGSVWLTLAEQIFLPETLNHCLLYYELLLNCCADTEHEKMFHMAPYIEITQEPINSVHTTGNVHAFVLWWGKKSSRISCISWSQKCISNLQNSTTEVWIADN